MNTDSIRELLQDIADQVADTLPDSAALPVIEGASLDLLISALHGFTEEALHRLHHAVMTEIVHRNDADRCPE